MKKLILGGAMLLVATGASAVEVTADFVGQLSHQEFDSWIVLDDEHALTCEDHSSSNSYIPVNWARVNLVLPQFERYQVLNHGGATMYETQDNGTPETLCAAVDAFVASVGDQQYAEVTKISDVRVSLVPRYGGGCERELIEQITIKLTDRLVLKSTNMRVLSGGSFDREDCLNLPPIFN